jgi:hypothetical protein
MDSAVAQFSGLFNKGSSHIFNCRDLTRKIEKDGDTSFLFSSNALNHAVFLKLPLQQIERSIKDIEKSDKFETKIYIPFEDNLIKGGQTINFSDKRFHEVIDNLQASRGDSDGSHYNNDRAILTVLDELPSFDPFLLTEKFRQAGLDVDERYFTLTKESWEEIRQFVISKFRPMIAFAYPNKKASAAQSIRLTELLWEAKDDPEVRNLLTSLSIPVDKIATVLYSWKGIIYYEYVYLKNNQKVKNILIWLDQIGRQLGGLTPVVKQNRDRIREKLSENVGSLLPILREHKKSYDDLFIHKRDPKPFVHFMSECSQQFCSLSRTLGQVMILLQVWENFCLRQNPQKASINQIHELFSTFEQNLLG